ncbi:unnamed protein product [Vicia faba]|uniref:Uncharacterized protein n=1 Tax=Vicia faba TaxID=3906 RepID=A0AAV0YJB6_VICFA|nr:unnamed protein product [Vicia faba]
MTVSLSSLTSSLYSLSFSSNICRKPTTLSLPGTFSLNRSSKLPSLIVKGENQAAQRNFPIDLKEAISSVIFATPRSVELCLDCGVNHLLVEKLSAKAPDGPTKIKILTAIAEEHNIKWESKSFGDNDTKASQDLLVGPSTPEKSAYVEPFQGHVPPPVHDEKGPPNSGGPSQLTPTHDAYTNSYDQSANTAARKASGNNSITSGMLDIEIKSSGDGSQKMDFRDTYSENKSFFPTGRQLEHGIQGCCLCCTGCCGIC